MLNIRIEGVSSEDIEHFWNCKGIPVVGHVLEIGEGVTLVNLSASGSEAMFDVSSILAVVEMVRGPVEAITYNVLAHYLIERLKDGQQCFINNHPVKNDAESLREVCEKLDNEQKKHP